MKTPQILTGQQAIDQFGLNALIECRVAITTELNGLGHSVMQIGVIADPDNCFIDLSDEPAVLYVEIEQDDDWILHPIMADEQFVLLDDKNQPASNELLARRIVELTNERDGLKAQVEQLRESSLLAFGDGFYDGCLHYAKLCGDLEFTDGVMRQSELAEAESVYGKQVGSSVRVAKIKAQAVEDARYSCEKSLLTVIDSHTGAQDFIACCESNDLAEYANQLRQQANGGE